MPASSIEFLRPIPSVALIPGLVVLVTKPQATMVIVVYASFWQMLIQVLYGVGDVDPVARDTARSYHLGLWRRIRYVVWPTALPSLSLAAAALFMLALAETSRVPVDDPATHLELTMIHEVIVLDHSGPEFAMILLGNAIKLALFGALVVSALVPMAQLPWWAAPLVLVVGLAVVAVGVGIVESTMARLRMNRVPQFLVAATALAVFAVILLLR